MLNDKMRHLRDTVIRHSKVIFPVIVIIAVAATVALALGAGRVEEQMDATMETPATIESSVEESAAEDVVQEIPLELNEDEAIRTLMYSYFNAKANGDVETIKSIKNYVEDTEIIWIQEMSKYIESFPVIEVYTKQGPVEGSYVAYVYTHVTFYGHENKVPALEAFYICTDESGNVYLNGAETSEEALDYVQTVSLQEDVVELINRTNAEYNDLLVNDSKFAEYISEVEREVSKATGEALAAQVTESQPTAEGTESEVQEGGEEQTPTGEEQTPVDTGAEQGPVYATATTTVNIRSSDSEQADKLGKVPGGNQVQVVEQRANGWSKIIYEGKEGYIKSEYLHVEGGNTGGEAIKTVKATTNVNLRKEASQTAEKIGVVVGGDSLEVLSEANGWCQVRYKGTVGYVKSEFVQ